MCWFSVVQVETSTLLELSPCLGFTRGGRPGIELRPGVISTELLACGFQCNLQSHMVSHSNCAGVRVCVRGLKLVYSKMIRCHPELLGRECFRWPSSCLCDTQGSVTHFLFLLMELLPFSLWACFIIDLSKTSPTFLILVDQEVWILCPHTNRPNWCLKPEDYWVIVTQKMNIHQALRVELAESEPGQTGFCFPEWLLSEIWGPTRKCHSKVI